MKWITLKLNALNLDLALNRSKTEFFSQSNGFSDFRKKYLDGLDNDLRILYVEGFEGDEIAASFILVFDKIQHQGKILDICFLTQVIVSTKFRKQNRVYSLVAEADKLALNYGAGITFVIARKSVANLYHKCGFSGFSHFSIFYTEKTSKLKTTHNPDFREANEADAHLIKGLHEKTYEDLNFFFPRSPKAIINLVNGHQFKCYVDTNCQYYFFSNSKSIIEIGFANKYQFEAILGAASCLKINEFVLNRNHLIFDYALKKNFQIVDRFEEKEGHLLKIHPKNLPTVSSFFPIAIGPDHFSEICELDQW
jgi:hypothetical protein